MTGVSYTALAALMFVLFGCASSNRGAAEAPRTLADLPVSEMERFYPSAQWHRVSQTKFEAFVEMEGVIRWDGSVDIRRTKECFPDASWIAQAMTLAREVRLQPTTLGSHIEPRAEVWVVFYPPSFGGSVVIVFGRQSDALLPGTDQRALYLNSRFE